MSVFDGRDPASWGPGIDEAVHTVSRGELIVLPTDTVYGIGADAFDARAVARLLAAKGRDRQMPPPVLIGDRRTLDGLATDVGDEVRALAEVFWPGGLTVICRAQPSLVWDLGETQGTVALRMPDEPCALALLKRTGPLAVSSANRTGSPAARSVAEAERQLGDAVAVYLDGGASRGGVASTIVDATGPVIRVVREGAVGLGAIRAVVPGVVGIGEEPSPEGASADDASTSTTDEPSDPGSDADAGGSEATV